jgi:hypothetical protein
MHEQHFDAVTRALAIPTRRGVSRLLSGGVIGLLSRERAGATHTGCRYHGALCKRHRQCCSGKCSCKGRCLCPGGRTK